MQYRDYNSRRAPLTSLSKVDRGSYTALSSVLRNQTVSLGNHATCHSVSSPKARKSLVLPQLPADVARILLQARLIDGAISYTVTVWSERQTSGGRLSDSRNTTLSQVLWITNSKALIYIVPHLCLYPQLVILLNYYLPLFPTWQR